MNLKRISFLDAFGHEKRDCHRIIVKVVLSSFFSTWANLAIWKLLLCFLATLKRILIIKWSRAVTVICPHFSLSLTSQVLNSCCWRCCQSSSFFYDTTCFVWWTTTTTTTTTKIILKKQFFKSSEEGYSAHSVENKSCKEEKENVDLN